MSRRSVFLALALIGGVLPYVSFIPFFWAEGLRLGDFIGALFVNGAAGGFATDLVISSVVFWIALFAEARRTGVARPWIYVFVNLTIGLSCALPLFLWARERATQGGEGVAHV